MWRIARAAPPGRRDKLLTNGSRPPCYPRVLRLLFVGDIYAAPGRAVARDHLADLVRQRQVDLVVANGENAAGGYGITPALAEEIFDLGVDVITTGNHAWDRKEIWPYWEAAATAAADARPRRLLRPANFPAGAPGAGVYAGRSRGGEPFAVLNLQGRVFMSPLDSPFRKADELLASLPPGTETILVDMHAEATSEKQAMGWHLDGRVTAVLGTHTHVPTADERILPGGTAFQTDVGMTGAYAGVIGSRKEEVLQRMMSLLPNRLEPAREDVWLCATLVESDRGRARSIERLRLRVNNGD